MTDVAGSPHEVSDTYTESIDQVQAVEREYLAARRAANDLPSLEEQPELWGVSLSGGGIRSATFCLGVMQSLTRRGLFSRFDYLSTVSGGGFIGVCLSSLLSRRADTGVDAKSSPFVGLRDPQDDAAPEDTELSVRHQLHHLRSHGQYLTPRAHILSRDVQRAVGAIVVGTVHTVVLFLLLFAAAVAGLHCLLCTLDGNLEMIAPSGSLQLEQVDGSWAYIKEVGHAWYEQRLAPPFSHLLASPAGELELLTRFVLMGAVWTALWLLASWILHTLIRDGTAVPAPTTRSGWTREDQIESRFVRLFNTTSVLLVIALTTAVSAVRTSTSYAPFLCGLLLPLAFALGGCVVAFPVASIGHTVHTYLLSRSRSRGFASSQRLRRSLLADIQGACFYGLLVAAAVPPVLLLLFSLSWVPFKVVPALGTVLVGYLGMRRWALPEGVLRLPGGWLRRPVADFAVLLFVAIVFAGVSDRLLGLYSHVGLPLWQSSLLVSASALALFVLFGVLVDVNRLSPHSFYRDRLSEAFLKTDASTLRPGLARQGRPLTVVRDDDDLCLRQLGEGNGRGPYHLIVSALNLQGSDELNRRTMLSEHFVFSRDWAGSRVTGWVRSSRYQSGRTTLARAMTISGAAASSATGFHSFGAMAFLATLLNIRLGYWMENPWYYRRPKANPERAWAFWPWYLCLEISGRCSARERLVNLSDGGHTGDNLGLVPLLNRRCATIVVCDAEADPKYSFDSFGNAVRMALIEDNILIDIDLTPIIDRAEGELGFSQSKQSVVEGTIHYPDAPPGRLLYVKASLSCTQSTDEQGEPASPCLPVIVTNYKRQHDVFPQQTTLDQYFDDEQFEAYRALGEHIGKAAADRLVDLE